MKIRKLKNYGNVLLMALTLTSCIQDDDFETPALLEETPNVNGNIIAIDAVLGILTQQQTKDGEDARATFNDTTTIMEGYVVSSDKAGNFFEQLILQDKPTNPTAGIRVLIDVNPLFTTYEFGRKVRVVLDGLSVGIENGVPTLGLLDGKQIGKIPSFSQKETLIRTPEIAEITPLEITFNDISDQILNQYVKVNNIQFNKKEVVPDTPFTYAAEPSDGFNGERILESCDTGLSMILSTSTFSDFKGLQLPTQQGSFEGVLTKNFFGDTFNLVLNDQTGLVFENPERCDPDVLTCTGERGGATIIYNEDFASLTTQTLETEDWINVNITAGALDYGIGSFRGDKYAQITGARSRENRYEVWLVTPEIDMDFTTAEQLDFDLQANFDNGNILDVFITNAYTGDVTTTTWTLLDANIPRGPLDGFGILTPAGPISISCIDHKIRIGFRYRGGDPGITTRYHIDNIKISGN